MRHWILIAASLSFTCAAYAGAPRLVRDINPTIISEDSNPQDLHDQGSWSFFVASDGAHFMDPWATDGTAAGTFRLNSINPLPSGTTGYTFLPVGGTSYFFANDPTTLSATVLWKTNGTAAGTQIVKDVAPDGVNPSIEGQIGGKLILSIFEPTKGREFWRSDGTAAGTERITDVNGTESAVYARVFANDKIYFIAGVDGNRFEPWVSNAAPGGAHKLGTISDNDANLDGPNIARAGNFVFFNQQTTASGNELWRVDLATDAVSQVKDIAPGTGSGISHPEFASVNGLLVFKANAVANMPGLLWRSDGTAAGTYQLGSLEPVSPGVTFHGPTSANRVVFFSSTSSGSWEAWSTDGTTLTQLPISQPGALGMVGGLLYMTGGSGEIWRTDGTVAGTHRLTGFPALNANIEVTGGGSQVFFRIRDGVGTILTVYSYANATETATPLMTYSVAQGQVFPSLFGYAQNRLYFDGTDLVTGREPYVSDGTVAGTRLLKDLASQTRTQPSDPKHLFDFKGKLFFSADDGVVGRELWTTDGTSGGTRLVANLNAGADSSDPTEFFSLNDKLYFFAKNGPNNNYYKLWTTDGTPGGTMAIIDAIPRSVAGGAQPCGANSVELGGFVYLPIYQIGSSLMLWRTDGTAAGTTRIQDSNQPLVDTPCWMAAFHGKAFFSANRWQDVGNELFSAAPGATPALVADIQPGSTGSQPYELTIGNDKLVFGAFGPSGWQAFASDGTSAGTVALAAPAAGLTFPNNFESIGGKVLFLGNSPQTFPGVRLFATDGTAANTARVGTVLANTVLHSDGQRVFFGSRQSQGGDGLVPWVSDATTAGTVAIGDPAASDLPSRLWFWDFNGTTILQAVDAAGNAQLWRSDGTRAGTVSIGDAGVASEYSYPNQHQAAGQIFYFVADKDGSGNELFAVENDAPLAGNDTGGTVQAGVALTINVLANDSDPDGTLSSSSVTIETQPAHGTATVTSTGSITYSANAGYAGADSFSYSVLDNQGRRSAAATVSVSVTAPPAPPSGGGGSAGGGGGRMGWPEILLLAILVAAVARRRSATR